MRPLLVGGLACCASVAVRVFRASDYASIMVVMPQVERVSGMYQGEAAPAVDFACSYHAHPHLAFCLELFAVPALGLGTA